MHDDKWLHFCYFWNHRSKVLVAVISRLLLLRFLPENSVRGWLITYLIIGKANLNFELVWHHKFIRFNWIIVVLLLWLTIRAVAFLLHHLLLLHLRKGKVRVGFSDLHPSGLAVRTVPAASAAVDHQRTSPVGPAVTLLPCRGPSAAFASVHAFRQAFDQGVASVQGLGQTSGHLASVPAASAAGLPPPAPALATGLLRFRSYLNQTVFNLITPSQWNWLIILAQKEKRNGD